MKLITQTPKVTLNKAFLKQRPLRSEIETFKANLQILLSKVQTKESEENKKNHVRDFLLDTYYKGIYEVNTKDRKDLVIHLDKTNESNVGVIVEAKSPDNKAEMLRLDKANTKALQELVLYYFDERQTKGNTELKNLVITNAYEWFIFDANVFDKKIYRNTQIKRLYETYKNDKKDNPFFYEELRKIFDNLDEEIICTYFDLREYEKIINNADLEDDKELIALYKILSPTHLLKLSFADDSNSLNKPFYDELLHIIGLEEVKIKSKSIIRRKEEGNRNQASLLENAITILKTKDSLRRIKNIADYGATSEERYFNVALELCIVWINRILFLKLLESQLVNYHKRNLDYRFLNIKTIPDFDELFTLFHQVLAKTFADREENIREKYKRVPYLNSSLFEISELEDLTISIESLKDTAHLSFINSTILKRQKAENQIFGTLEYLFKFLDAYDFASEGAADVQEDNRSLINASVLGKVFEKINGYKDGSIFTPGFITMYMCRQAIRLAVIQKFKDAYELDIDSFDELTNFTKNTYKTEKILEYNALVNSLHLCDPAVGSGHYLVSSLNEIIAIKSELGILADQSGVRLSEYQITIENDELIITDEKGDIFEYQINETGKPTDKAQRLQKTLFHEKQTLIENCLFGVDINPNSVKICRLRLWIELLKNAYYKESANFAELETLPNIDINIKEGNSLVSRFALDEDLKKVLKTVKYSIEDYRNFVLGYKETRDREAKREFESKIRQIKDDFKTQLFFFSPERIKLADLENQLKASESKQYLFGEAEDEKAKRLKDEDALKAKIAKAKAAIKQAEENAIYKNAFEWRFEFPEVLDDDGNFTGFDIVIGNPPYGVILENNAFEIVKKQLNNTLLRDSYFPFILKGLSISNENKNLAFIIPNTWRLITSAEKFRKYIFENFHLYKIDTFLKPIFDEAVVDCDVIFVSKNCKEKIVEVVIKDEQNSISKQLIDNDILLKQSSINTHLTNFHYSLIEKINNNSETLGEILTVKNGVKPYEVGKGQPPQTREIVETKPFTSNQKENDSFFPLIGGSNFQKYILLWNDDNWISYGNHLAAPRDKAIFEADEKIIVRQTSDKIIATKIGSNFIVRNNTHIILKQNDEVNLLYLLALLNSKLLDFIYWTINPERGEALAEVKAFHLEKLPIKKIEEKDQQSFVALVDRILELKKDGKDTQALENEIDALVYRLYDLTAEEIAIVEEK